MKTLSFTHHMAGRSSVLTLSLLLGVLSASAFQTATPGISPGTTLPAPANAGPGHTNLTPAAPVSSQVPAASEEDVRDIRQPRHLPTSLPWAAAAAGVIILAAMAFAASRWIRRGKFFEMLPYEIALQYLEEARRLMDPAQAREYCFAVSKLIRRYIEERFHVHAPNLTTEEFLRDLVEVRVRDTMLESHRALLGEFLQHCDLAKFAGWRYSMPDLEAMHATARRFVQETASDPVPAAKNTPPAVVPEAATSSTHANEAGASCGESVSA
jgi:hypothetical protein